MLNEFEEIKERIKEEENPKKEPTEEETRRLKEKEMEGKIVYF